MSRAEILSEIPKLSHEARREIMRCLIEAEEEAVTLADCDKRALERFQMLDGIEAADEKNASRRNLAGGFRSGRKSEAALILSDYRQTTNWLCLS